MAFSATRTMMGAAGSGNSNSWIFWNGSADGSQVLFDAATASGQVSVKVDTNKLLIVWTQSGSPGKIRSVIATTAGNVVTYGTVQDVVTLGANTTNGLSVALLDTGRAVVVYTDSGSTGISGKILSISGTTISVGSAAGIIGSGSPSNVSVVKTDTDKCVITYLDTTVGKSAVFTTSGTTVNTAGTPFQFVASAVNSCPAVTIDSTHVLVAYGTSATASVVCLLIGAATITAPTAAASIVGASCSSLGVCLLSPVSAFVGYELDSSSEGYGVAISVVGTTVTAGTPTTLGAGGIAMDVFSGGSVAALNSSQAMIIYELSATDVLYGIVATVSGSAVTFATRAIIAAATVGGDRVGSASLDTSRILVALNTGYGLIVQRV